jgi:hypothetical protein
MKSILIVATLLAAALTTAVPTPASAATNNGSFQQSSEGHKVMCQAYKEAFEEVLSKSRTAKSKDQAAKYRDSANYFLGRGWEEGCSWAQ